MINLYQSAKYWCQYGSFQIWQNLFMCSWDNIIFIFRNFSHCDNSDDLVLHQPGRTSCKDYSDLFARRDFAVFEILSFSCFSLFLVAVSGSHLGWSFTMEQTILTISGRLLFECSWDTFIWAKWDPTQESKYLRYKFLPF